MFHCQYSKLHTYGMSSKSVTFILLQFIPWRKEDVRHTEAVYEFHLYHGGKKMFVILKLCMNFIYTMEERRCSSY